MADGEWQSLTFATNNTKAIKGFLKDIDGCIKVVKQLAQLAQANVAFLQLLLTGLANPFFIVIQVLCQAIEDYVNSLFNAGLYYMVIHSGNTDLEKVAKFKKDAEFVYPGQLLRDILNSEEKSASYEMMAMAMRINSALPDSQKVRDAERARRPKYLSEQFLRPHEIAATEYVSQIQQKTSLKFTPKETKDIKLRFIYNEIKDDVFLVQGFTIKYGSSAKRIIAEREGKADLANITDDDDGNNDGVLGSTARSARYLMDSGLAYVGRRAEALGLTQLSPKDVLDGMASALDDKGDFNRPGAPLFELHTSAEKAERAETRIKNPQNYFFAQSQKLQFEAILKNASAQNKSAVQAKLDAVNQSLATLENDTEEVFGEIGKPKRDKYGRPRLRGFNAGGVKGDPFGGNDFGFFQSVDYESSLDQELDNGFTKYSGAIFYVGAATIDAIPLSVLELLGRVFNGFDKYFADLTNRLTMAFNEHTKARSIHMRNICMVSAQKPLSGAAAMNPFFPKMQVKESFHKIEEGTILIGEQSKNTVIVLKNERTEKENIVAVDDRGNVYNPYSTLTATQTKNERIINQNTVGSFNITQGDSSPPDITFSQNEESSYSAQRLLVMPYTNSQGGGKYEMIEGQPFQPGELVYQAIEEGDGTIDIDKQVVSGSKSCVLGTFNTELGDFSGYEFPPSIGPDFAPKITVAEFFPDFAFAVRNTILGFTQFLRGLAKGGANAVSELVQLLDDVIKFLKELETGIVNFLKWLQSLAALADSGIYGVTFSANGKAGLKKKFEELKTAPGAPPEHLKYSFAILLLGAESDFGAFQNFLNTNQAFKTFEEARAKYGDLLEKSLKGFQNEIKDQLGEALRRGGHMESVFKEDMLRNSDLDESLMVLPNAMSGVLGASLDMSDGGTDRFDKGGTGKEGSGGYVALTGAENDLLDGQQALRDPNQTGVVNANLLNADLAGFSSNEMRRRSDKLKFYWRFEVERLSANDERSQRVIAYSLYWAKAVKDEFENITYEKLDNFHTWLSNDIDFEQSVSNDVPLIKEVEVGANTIPKGTTHVLLVSVAEIRSRAGDVTVYTARDSEVEHVIPISTTLPASPEVVVDDVASSVSVVDKYLTNLTFTIEDQDSSGPENTSSVLGFRIFFGDANGKDLTTDPFMSIVLPAGGGIQTVSLVNRQLDSGTYVAPIETLVVYAENQNGLSPAVVYPLSKISAPREGAVSASFTDTNPDRYTVSGTLLIERGTGHVSEFGIDDVYRVFFGQFNPAINAVAIVGSQVGADVNYRAINQQGLLEAPIPLTTLDKTVTHFMIFTARDKQTVPGQKVVSRTSFNIAINDNGYFPRFAPEGIEFIDELNDPNEITGTFTLTPAVDESFIDNYAIYYGTQDFIRVDTNGRKSNAQGFIGAITLGTSTELTMEEEEHGVRTGELITFTGVSGTTELNNNDYYAVVDAANSQIITLFTDTALSVPLDSSTFTPHVANSGIINHGVTPISDDDLAELSRPVSNVAVPDEAFYYMAFSKNGAGESRNFAFLDLVDPQVPNSPGEIVRIVKNIPIVQDVT